MMAAPLFSSDSAEGLESLNVLGLPALGSFHDVELHGLAFLQAAEAGGPDGAVMYEYILTILAADEAVALGVVKPLHCSCFHVDANFLFF